MWVGTEQWVRNEEGSQKFVEARIPPLKPPQPPPAPGGWKQGWDRRNMQSEQVATTEVQCAVTAEELSGTPRNTGYTRNAQTSFCKLIKFPMTKNTEILISTMY
jgi:hypothetical protein